MSLTAAVSGCVVFLLSMAVLQGQHNWGVNYTSTQICALRGSTVDIKCTYTYPSRVHERDTEVMTTVWFTKENHGVYVDLRTDPEYAGRVQHRCDKNHCSLRITDLRKTDSAEYKFMFTTNQPGGRITGSPGVTLIVTELHLVGQASNPANPQIHLTCFFSCGLPDHSSYIWYRNGEEFHRKKSPDFFLSVYYGDSITCAVEGHEDLRSESILFGDSLGIRVLYTDRRICASKGSSVNISCSYSNILPITSSFWFSPERRHQWQIPSQPEDLSEDSQYAGRVQVLETRKGGSTLRISDLRDTDSAQYRFEYETPNDEGGRSFPGTTLIVTALQVEVNAGTAHESDTEAELQCVSSCGPATRVSYVWFKNGQEVEEEKTFLYTGRFNHSDHVSCALKGHEEYRSPPVCKITSICHNVNMDPRNTQFVFTRAATNAPKLPSVSVSPSGEIVENSSVNLTCSSDANPAFEYTWYKNEDPDLQRLSEEPQLVFSSIQSSDSGEYYCTAKNKLGKRTSEHIFIDVKLESIFIMNIIKTTFPVLMLIFLLPFSLWIRKKKTLSSTSELNEPAETVELDVVDEKAADLQVVTAAQTQDTEDYDDVE